jgi:hypothetical protein
MWINTYPSHILPGDNMINKNELIRKILNETIRFKADGKTVTVSQFEDAKPIIQIGDVEINAGVLSLFNVFEIPNNMDTPYGVVEYDFAGVYNYTKER